ncbi:MAG TPA: acetate--CoA ligase family protein, partial [Acidimicrobiales bacterium]|nr:acetate--CoA ligase family protein [Acidimicrobiales bacterium]
RPEGTEPDLPHADANAARRALAGDGTDAPPPGDGADAPPPGDDGWITGPRARAVLDAYGILGSGGPRPDVASPPGSPGGGIEAVAGFVQEPSFGPLVRLGPPGAAGPGAPHGVALAPLTVEDAQDLVRPLSGAGPGLGATADGPGDLGPVVDLVLRLGRLAEDLPEVAEAECRLVLGPGTGVSVSGARLRLTVPVRADDRRRLT